MVSGCVVYICNAYIQQYTTKKVLASFCQTLLDENHTRLTLVSQSVAHYKASCIVGTVLLMISCSARAHEPTSEPTY
jgi:hypothetical protein